MDTIATATILAALVLLASMASVELGVSVAIIEIALGVFAGNVLGITSTPWIDFLGLVRGDPAHLPRRSRGRSAAPTGAVPRVRPSWRSLVRRPVRRRRALRVFRRGVG